MRFPHAENGKRARNPIGRTQFGYRRLVNAGVSRTARIQKERPGDPSPAPRRLLRHHCQSRTLNLFFATSLPTVPCFSLVYRLNFDLWNPVQCNGQLRGTHMNAITVNRAKEELDRLLRQVIADAEPVIICNDQDEKAVLLSLEEFNAWQETLYLLSNPANAEHLRKSISEARAGETVERELIDLSPPRTLSPS